MAVSVCHRLAMTLRLFSTLCLLFPALLFGCGNGNGTVSYTPNPNWPAAVNDLGRVIAQKQRDVVKPGGDVWNPGFSSNDLTRFTNSNRLQDIVTEVKNSPEFAAGVAALKGVPVSMQEEVLLSYSKPVDLTWSQTGQIGNGTTDAGQSAERMIAAALTEAVKAALQ